MYNVYASKTLPTCQGLSLNCHFIPTISIRNLSAHKTIVNHNLIKLKFHKKIEITNRVCNCQWCRLVFCHICHAQSISFRYLTESYMHTSLLVQIYHPDSCFLAASYDKWHATCLITTLARVRVNTNSEKEWDNHLLMVYCLVKEDTSV